MRLCSERWRRGSKPSADAADAIDARCKRQLSDQRPSVTHEFLKGTVVVQQSPCVFETGLRMWEASAALHHYLDAVWEMQDGAAAWTRPAAGCRVVELCAGCGVAGMAFALRGASVTFTDLPEVVGHCERNVRANVADATSLSFLPYRLGDDVAAAGLEPPYDVVVASEPLLHALECIDPLLHALKALTGRDTVVVLASERRIPAVWEGFVAGLRDAFRVVEAVPASQLRRALSRKCAAEDLRWLSILRCTRL